jgi:hypothetical protein
MMLKCPLSSEAMTRSPEPFGGRHDAGVHETERQVRVAPAELAHARPARGIEVVDRQSAVLDGGQDRVEGRRLETARGQPLELDEDGHGHHQDVSGALDQIPA